MLMSFLPLVIRYRVVQVKWKSAIWRDYKSNNKWAQTLKMSNQILTERVRREVCQVEWMKIWIQVDILNNKTLPASEEKRAKTMIQDMKSLKNQLVQNKLEVNPEKLIPSEDRAQTLQVKTKIDQEKAKSKPKLTKIAHKITINYQTLWWISVTMLKSQNSPKLSIRTHSYPNVSSLSNPKPRKTINRIAMENRKIRKAVETTTLIIKIQFSLKVKNQTTIAS